MAFCFWDFRERDSKTCARVEKVHLMAGAGVFFVLFIEGASSFSHGSPGNVSAALQDGEPGVRALLIPTGNQAAIFAKPEITEEISFCIDKNPKAGFFIREKISRLPVFALVKRPDCYGLFFVRHCNDDS
jgi:hypothetical protein